MLQRVQVCGLADVVGVVQGLILAGTVIVLVLLFLRGETDGQGGDLALLVMLGVTLTVGWLIASRMPRHPMGWLLLTISGVFLLGAVAFASGYLLVDHVPGAAPAAPSCPTLSGFGPLRVAAPVAPRPVLATPAPG